MCYDVNIRWEHERREFEMLANVITTALDNLWYEIWQGEQDGESTFAAIRYDAEQGVARTVATEWTQSYAERMIRNDMARLGIA